MTDASVPLFRLEPGLFLRPRPSHMAKDTAAVKLGGGPQLPDDIDWPKNLTFYAQIDLSKLARSVILDGNTYAIDKLPDRGTLFVFLPLFDGQVYDGANAKVFHVEADVSHLPERAPPDDLGNLRDEETNWSSYWLDVVGLSPCGRLLYRQYADLLPFLATRSANAQWDYLGEPDDIAEYVLKEDVANALSVKSMINALEQMPIPPIDDDAYYQVSPHSRRLDLSRLTASSFSSATLSWEFIFEWSRTYVVESYALGMTQIRRLLADSDDISEKTRALLTNRNEMFDKACKHARTQKFGTDQTSHWTTMFTRPSAKGCFDAQAQAWMNFSAARTGVVKEKLQSRFLDFIRRAQSFEYGAKGLMNLTTIDNWQTDHALDEFEVRSLAHEVKGLTSNAFRATWFMANFSSKPKGSPIEAARKMPRLAIRQCQDKEVVDAYWDARVYRETQIPSPDNAQSLSFLFKQAQILGAPECSQSLVDEEAYHKTLLFAIHDREQGLQVAVPDRKIYLWIRQEDLQKSRFDGVEYRCYIS